MTAKTKPSEEKATRLAQVYALLLQQHARCRLENRSKKDESLQTQTSSSKKHGVLITEGQLDAK